MAFTEQQTAYRNYIKENKSKLDSSQFDKLKKDTWAFKDFQSGWAIPQSYFQSQPKQKMITTELWSRLDKWENKKITDNDWTTRTYMDNWVVKNDFRKTTPEVSEEKALPATPLPSKQEATPLPTSQGKTTPSETPDWTDVKQQEIQPLTDIASWKAAWGKMEDLWDMIENKYWSQAVVEWNSIISEINWEKFKWDIDSAWNPKKTSLWRVDSEQHLFAREKWIDTQTVWGKTVFNPQNIDQAMDIYDRFWPDAEIWKESNVTIRASAAYKYLDKYTGGSVDTLLDGLRKSEIGVSWETWDRLVRRNNWEASPEMIEAQRRFEDDIKLYAVNEGNAIISTAFSEEWETESRVVNRAEAVSTAISKLDTDFQAAISNIYNANDVSFADYKNKNQKLTSLNDEINSTSEQIDELNTSKRGIMNDIKAKYPSMDRSSQIELYNQKAEAFDDQLFVLQRTQNSQISAYNLESTQTQAEYEYNIKKSEQKIGLIQDMYKIQRWDLSTMRAEARADEIREEWFARQDEMLEKSFEREDMLREEDFERQDQLLNDSLTRAEEQRKQAIIDWDAERAKSLTYESALLEEKLKLNRKYSDDIKLLWGNSYLKRDPDTMEWELEAIPTSESATSSWISEEFQSDNKFISAQDGDYVWVQCWTFARSAAWMTGTPWGNNLEERVKAFSDSSPIAGGMLLFNGGNYDKTYWHISLVTWVDADAGTITIKESNLNGDNKVTTREISMDDPAISWYYNSTPLAQKNSNAMSLDEDWSLDWTSLATASGIALEIFGSKVSDGERLTVKAIMESSPDLTWEEVMLAVKRFDIKDKDSRDYGNNLLSIARWAGLSINDLDLSSTASLINKWNLDRATKQIEDKAIALKKKDGIISKWIYENDVKTSVRKAKELEDLITQAEEFNGWPIDGKIQKALWKFKTPEAQELATKITSIVAEIRLELSGTAVTEEEWKANIDIYPSLDDSMQNMLIKINNLRVQPLRKLNDARSSAWLPEISEDILFNQKRLPELYGYKPKTLWPEKPSGSSFMTEMQGSANPSTNYTINF